MQCNPDRLRAAHPCALSRSTAHPVHKGFAGSWVLLQRRASSASMRRSVAGVLPAHGLWRSTQLPPNCASLEEVLFYDHGSRMEVPDICYANSGMTVPLFEREPRCYGFRTPWGTWPVATCSRAESQWTCWSSKKMSAPNAARKGPFDLPPRKSASSIRMPHSLNVRMTRLWAGAERAVTRAVRIGL